MALYETVDDLAPASQTELMDIGEGTMNGIEPPENVLATYEAHKGETYIPNSPCGIDALAQGLCEIIRLRTRHKLTCGELFVVKKGARGALLAALSHLRATTLLRKPVVAVFAPSWILFDKYLEEAGFEPYFVPTKEEDGYKPTAQLIDSLASIPGLAGILFNRITTPTGANWSAGELRQMADAVRRLPSRPAILEDHFMLMYGNGVVPTFAMTMPDYWREGRIYCFTSFKKGWAHPRFLDLGVVWTAAMNVHGLVVLNDSKSGVFPSKAEQLGAAQAFTHEGMAKVVEVNEVCRTNADAVSEICTPLGPQPFLPFEAGTNVFLRIGPLMGKILRGEQIDSPDDLDTAVQQHARVVIGTHERWRAEEPAARINLPSFQPAQFRLALMRFADIVAEMR